MGDQDAKSSEKKNRNIHQFHIDHNIPCLPLPPSRPPPEEKKICKTIVFDFSLGVCTTQ